MDNIFTDIFQTSSSKHTKDWHFLTKIDALKKSGSFQYVATECCYRDTENRKEPLENEIQSIVYTR